MQHKSLSFAHLPLTSLFLLSQPDIYVTEVTEQKEWTKMSQIGIDTKVFDRSAQVVWYTPPWDTRSFVFMKKLELIMQLIIVVVMFQLIACANPTQITIF
jgi:hypothetical protein